MYIIPFFCYCQDFKGGLWFELERAGSAGIPHKVVKSQRLEIAWLLLSFGSRALLGNAIRNRLRGGNVPLGQLLLKLREDNRLVNWRGSCSRFLK